MVRGRLGICLPEREGERGSERSLFALHSPGPHEEARDILTYANPDYYWGFDNAEFQDLVSRADEGSTDEQTQYMRQAAKLLSDLAVSDWLYLQAYVTITAAGVTGLPVNLLGESLNVTNVSWS